MPQEQKSAFGRQLDGYRLATAEIIYRMPDHPSLLQSFIWQHYDLAPNFPELMKFLEFWRRNLDGQLHEVRVVRQKLLGPSRYGHVEAIYRLH